MKTPDFGLRWNAERFLGLLMKEWREILQDPSAFVIGLGLPVFMLLLYVWGISMDMTSIPAAVVLEESTPEARSLAFDFEANRYFEARMHPSLASAEAALARRDVECILVVPSDFARRSASGDAALGLAVYGVDSNSALIFKNYAEGVVRTWLAKSEARSGSVAAASGDRPVVRLTTRSWFNEASISTHYIVPGLLALVTGVAGSLLGAVAVAREWERGTMTSLLALSASGAEIVAAKGLLLWGIVFTGDLLCLAAATLFFDVSIRGALPALLLALALFAAWSLLLGLFVSAKTKSQFLASEAAVLLSFMPTLMLSGFLFDLRSVPVWIETIGRVLPPTHAIEALRILSLSGGSPVRVAVNLPVVALWPTAAFLPSATPLEARGATAVEKGKA